MNGGAAAGESAPPIQSIQLLRAVAAGSVALTHLAFGFSDHVGDGLGLGSDDGQVGQTAVALFFLVSGYIMVVSSAKLYGTERGTAQFWQRRAIRILPPYWLATGLLLAVLAWLERPIEGRQIAPSLLLWPYYSEGAGHPFPLLWPGWTLFHELLFYALFGAGISVGKWRAVGFASAVIAVLIIIGQVWPPGPAIMFSLTRPIALLFIAGMAFALWRTRADVRALPLALRWLMAGCAAVLLLLPFKPDNIDALGFAWLGWAGVPALLLFAAAICGPFNLPWFGVVDLAGRTSFALYLLHVPVAWLWTGIYPDFLYPLGAWFYLATLVAGSIAASFVFHFLLERPLTRRLNRLVGPA